MDERFRAILASQGELVGSITHDLKGLLSGMEGGIYLVNSGLKKDKKERVEQGFEMMERNLSRMRRQVACVLYYVKDRQNNWESVEIKELAASVEKALSQQATHLGVGLDMRVNDGSFEADELAIHSLLVDLVQYSLEACALAKLKPSPSVKVRVTRTDAHITFKVSSDGFVIDEEARDHALGEFYSPRGVDRSHLGLFVAKKIAKSHNGNLQITSNADEGTTCFSVELPLTKSEASSDEGDSSTQEAMAREWNEESI
jgi:signal transduction histidine kinase